MLVRLCEDFIAIIKSTEVGPVPALLVSFLQQAAAGTGANVGPLSGYIPQDLVGQLSFVLKYLNKRAERLKKPKLTQANLDFSFNAHKLL